ncbi:MAG TPA: hypothetical protein VK210_03160 [Terriglobia bacterium]|nr:hypothetical protein [Terriglobia bacterium]
MADKELIIGLLERVRRRVRSERRVKAVSSGLPIALIFPVIFKLIDLRSPFRGITVAVFLAVWGIVTIAWLIWNSRGRDTMSAAAATLDSKTGIQDQMRTAYWFIRNPSQSEWVDVLIQKAAKSAQRLRVEALFPGFVPRTIYGAVALLLAFVLLNFLPQSLNHNWLYLQGAPPFHLSRSDQALVDHAKQLLDKTKAANELEKIISDLEQGKISADAAQQELSNLRQQIDGGNLELNNILDGLTSIANQLGQSPALASAAQSMSQGDLESAADQIRSLAEKLGVTPDEVLRELQKNLSQAASNSPAGLQDLSKLMQQASDALKSEDTQTGKVALQNLAQALDQLAQKMKGQQQQSQASQQLADLQNSLQQEAAADSASDAQLVPTPSQGQGTGGNAGGDPSSNGKPTAGDSTGNGQGTQPGGTSASSSFGSPEDLKPGQMTKLDVQLKMEGLKGQAGKGGQPQDVEEASKQERSAMDYRNVPSQLSPAQKDALNQNRLPREQREIVKTYFEEIRPQSSKPTKP